MNSDRKRIVFDTSALISACLYPEREPAHIFRLALIEHDVYASSSTLNELNSVLQRPKFDTWRPLAYRRSWVSLFSDAVLLIEPSVQMKACRDPKDDQFLELAVSAQAHILVSSDVHLLEMNPFRGIHIVNWKEFSSLIGFRSSAE